MAHNHLLNVEVFGLDIVAIWLHSEVKGFSPVNQQGWDASLLRPRHLRLYDGVVKLFYTLR